MSRARLEIAHPSRPNDMPELLNLVPAQISDHDSISAHPLNGVWPTNLSPSTLKLHQHFVELIATWNANPFRRDMGTAAVDQFAETLGKSRFSFTTKESLDDFLQFYMLDDFVLTKVHASRSDAFHYLELTNKFLPSEIEQFFTIYRDAMNALAQIEVERNRAIRIDGNRVGYITADHFTQRAAHELHRIMQARQNLGANTFERN